ncbi:hypothetical protein JCM5296_003673 [Sporobolomyces johnsonii]
MGSNAGYIPLRVHPSPSLAGSRLFNTNLSPPDPPLRRCLDHLPRPSPKTALAVGITVFFAILLIAQPTGGRSALQRSLLEVGVDPDLGFDELYEASRAGWIPLVQREGLLDNSPEEQLSTWADRLPLGCAEAWVENGELCEGLRDELGEESAVDVLWTYTNGSDPLLRTWRAEVTGMLSGRVRPGVATVREAKTARHFREHDELRYSVRSVVQAFAPSAVRKIHLLTADVPANGLLRDILDPHRTVDESAPVLTASRLGQRPTWLNASASAVPPLELSHHSAIFENEVLLPTFNSLSIESQFPSLCLASEHFLYMNEQDDTFLMGASKLTPADIGAPLLGPVFRIQTDLTVSGTSPTESVGDREGEWASLRRANWLLDRRFGQRSRGYIAHLPKAFSLPLLKEVGMLWHDELSETASSRFRGLKTEYQLAFLATHYIIESHRQALLHSFFVARSDRNLDGELSLDERRQMLEELGFDVDADRLRAEVSVVAPRRATKERLPRLLARAGLAAPGATEIAFSSMDGHGIYRGAEQDRHKTVRPVDYDGSNDQEEPKPYCTLKLERCFGENFLSARKSPSSVKVFRRVAFEHTACGDCAIVALVGKSGPSGLSAFLPPPSPSPSSSTANDPPFTPLSLFSPTLKDHSSPSSSAFALPSPASAAWIRQRAIHQILRYSYVLGDSSSNFQSMRQARLVQLVLDQLSDDARDKPTFLTLNDDFVSDLAAARADGYLKRFFESQWPDPSPYELVE